MQINKKQRGALLFVAGCWIAFAVRALKNYSRPGDMLDYILLSSLPAFVAGAILFWLFRD